ncbi:zf-HC2 domain-containing protein [Candidatus Uhrbacteria bacterium]|nr:zf-HC2 domain-containing protein [Candidatus Uhrbacteria bacterium]
MAKVISCKAFKEMLERDGDLTEEECSQFEVHLNVCRRHNRQMAEVEAAIAPRLVRYGQELRDAFDSGVVDGTSWENLPEFLSRMVSEGEFGVVEKILARCAKHKNDIRAIRVIALMWQIVPDMRDRISQHFDIRSTIVSATMINNLQEAVRQNALPDEEKRKIPGRIAALQLLYCIDPKTGEVTFENAPALVWRGADGLFGGRYRPSQE